MLVLLAFTAVCLASVALADAKPLAQPCRARNILSGQFFTDRQTGHECLAMVDMNEISGAELLIIDMKTGKGKSYKCPAGQGGWALLEVPGDRLAIGTFFDGQYMVFDLKKMKFVKTIGVPGEGYIWDFALGSDGKLYGGTYPGGKLVSLDLNDYTVKDCGAPAPPNMYLRNVSRLPDGRIFCYFGMEKPAYFIYDPSTSKFVPAPKQLEGITKGISWNGYFLSGRSILKGAEFEEITDLPYPKSEGSLWINAGPSRNDELVLAKDNTVYTYSQGDKSLTLVNTVKLKGGRLLDVSAGKVAGIRGQDYFILAKGKKTTFKRLPLVPGPRSVLFMKSDEKGNLWGGPPFGQTLFKLDPKSGKSTNTATVCDGGGEVYDACFVNGQIYAVAYAGGDIIHYNPGAKWDQFNNVNPKTIASLGSKGYIRPTGGILYGPDKKLYSGWMAAYGTYGGAVAVTDPNTGESRLIENPFANLSISGLAVDEKHLYIGTSTDANGLPQNPLNKHIFGVLDIATNKILFQQEFQGAGNVRIPALVSGKVIVLDNDKLSIFDAVKQQMIETLPSDTPAVTSYCCAVFGNYFYYGSKKSVVQFNLVQMKWKTIQEMPDVVNNIAITPSGSIFVSCDSLVYKIDYTCPR